MNRVGNQEPTYRWSTDYQKTEGIYASQLAAAYGLPPHEWQQKVLNDWLAVDDEGKLINNYCLLEVPRQNGKTGVSDPRETWGLVKRAEQILHTAQEYQTAKKAFDRLRKKFGTHKGDPFAEFPELNALVDHYTTSANQMVLDLTNGGHIEFRTRGSNSDMGRGGTFDLIVIDEAQSYTEAQDASLSPLNSAAPSGSPQTILMGTVPTPESGNRSYIFRKSIDGMHEHPEAGQCIHEWSVNEVGDVTDVDRWYATNPSLGYQLLLSALQKDAKAMSPDYFAREHLGYMQPNAGLKQAYIINRKKWQGCASEQLKPEGKTAYGVKFSPDGSEVILCGAVIDKDGCARISVIERQSMAKGVRWLADWLNARYDKASCVVIDGKNGADTLIERIIGTWKYKDSIIKASTQTVITAASSLVAEINENTITWYKEQMMLDESAKNAVQRRIGQAWGFGGEDPLPIEGCSLALWGVRNSKRNPNRKMRIG